MVWGLVAVAIAAFAVAPVLLSQDVYSYLDYARLGVVHGLDPYVHPPAAAPADPVYPLLAWTEATSAYGPLFTLATYPLAWLPVGLAVALLKASAALSVAALALLVARIAAWRGIEPLRAVAFVALNPLVLVHVVGGAHNDGLAMALAMLAVAAALSERWAGAGAARRHLGPLLVGAAGAALAVGAAALLAFGWDWTGAFGLAGENQDRTSFMSIPVTLARLTGLDPSAVRATALVLYAAALAYLLARTWRGFDWVRAAAWASIGLLLASAWLLPWYLVWVLPLAAVCRDRPLRLLTLALTAYQLGARIPV